MAEPFMPAHQPASTPDPTEHDIDTDVDVIFDTAPSDADGEAVHAGAPDPAFRTPVAGDKLTSAELDAELNGDETAGY